LPTLREKVSRRIVYFPGSTIGNFDPADARIFFEGIAELLERGGAFLIGVDLKKDVEILEDAYNDSEGITAEFNRNILRRMNRELSADFDIEKFEHSAFYNHDRDRIELHLVSLADQTVRVANREVSFEEGETIHTENSYKYSLEGFARLAGSAGFAVERVWTDPDRLFSVQYLTV
jgi:dimethylhistidine N-methyltransferase